MVRFIFLFSLFVHTREAAVCANEVWEGYDGRTCVCVCVAGVAFELLNLFVLCYRVYVRAPLCSRELKPFIHSRVEYIRREAHIFLI